MLEATPSTRHIFVDRAVTVVSEPEGVIRGYISIWGSPDQRDSYDTWWDRERPAEIAADFVPYPIQYEHALDGVLRYVIVGSVDKIWPDDVGYAFEGHLDRSIPYFQKVLSEIRTGELKTSSATGAHLAEFYPDGAFKNWPLVELSLTKTPAEERMPAVSLIRSQEQARDALEVNGNQPIRQFHEVSNMTDNVTPVPPVPAAPRDGDLGAVVQQLLSQYSMDEIVAALQQLQAPAADAAMSAPAQQPPRSLTAGDLITALEATRKANELAALQNKVRELEAARIAPPADDATRHVRVLANSVSVSEPRKFSGRSRSDLMLAYEVLRSKGARISNDLLQVMAGRTADAIEKKDPSVVDPSFRAVMPATRSDEIMTSTNSGNGDEWVGVAYSGDLWEKARSNRIYQELVSRGMRVEEVPQGDESVVIFTESTDPTVYTIAQSTDADATGRPTVNMLLSNTGTGNVTLTPGQLGLAAAYSDVFEEDSMVKAAPQLNRQINEKMQETIEQLMINGDVQTSTTNVNYDGGTPGTGTSTPYYIASDGFRKYALVTGSNTNRSGSALDENDFRLTLKLLPSAVRTRKGQLAFIFDPDTHNTALDIAAIKTEDVKRTNATIVSGMLENIYGVDCFESGFLPLADTDGKVTYNGNVADTGTILCVYAPFWAMGWKRKITIETDRDILAGTNIIVAKMRLGFKARGAGAAVATYNVTIA